MLLLALGCADPIGGSSPPQTPDAGPAVAPGCLLFQKDNAGVALLQGAGLSLSLGSSALWMFDGATLPDGGGLIGGLSGTVSGDSASQCFPATALDTGPAFALLPQGSDFFVVPMDMISIGGTVWSYYQVFQLDSTAAFGVQSAGYGIAPFDDSTGQFVPDGNLLWTADQPSFGTSAIVLNGEVYAYGCGTLPPATSPSCYLAQAPVASANDASAYQYAVGSGRYSSNVGDALPIIENMGDVSVRVHSTGEILATYVLPLDTNLTIQAALTPYGPFSDPITLAACQLESGDFCSGARQHPEIDPDSNTIAISYVAATFNAEPPGDRYWPRLAFVSLPPNLP